MSSRLKTVPRDILQHIAFLSTSSSVFDPPIEIRNLLLTSSCIYQSLNLHAAPHVFAQLLHTKFDTDALFRRYSSSITHSLLAEEMSNRCRLLRRARRTDFSSLHLTRDLLTALWLIVESNGLNERQLINSNFPAFILGLAYNKLQESQTDQCLDQHIIILLLSLALPRVYLSITGTVLDMSKDERDELYGLIYPFISVSSRVRCFFKWFCLCYSSFHLGYVFQNSQSLLYADLLCPNGCSFPYMGNSAWHASGFPTHLGRPIIKIPDTSCAAINLAFVIYEMRQLKLPYHLPENRVISNASQLTGPTKDDYKAMFDYRTALFADCLPTTDEPTSLDITPRRSMNHDLEFGSLLQISTCLQTFIYTPGCHRQRQHKF